jgi:hypothetical protein
MHSWIEPKSPKEYSMSILSRINLRQFLLAICLMVLPVFALKAGAQENLPLKLIATTPMPDFTGDFDHFGVDLTGKRLFLAAEEHQSVEVFDLQTGKRITSITNFEQPYVMVYLPGSNPLVVTDGDKGGQLALLSGKDYSILKAINLPPGVNHGAFNPVKNHYYVESGPEAAGGDSGEFRKDTSMRVAMAGAMNSIRIKMYRSGRLHSVF